MRWVSQQGWQELAKLEGVNSLEVHMESRDLYWLEATHDTLDLAKLIPKWHLFQKLTIKTPYYLIGGGFLEKFLKKIPSGIPEVSLQIVYACDSHDRQRYGLHHDAPYCKEVTELMIEYQEGKKL